MVERTSGAATAKMDIEPVSFTVKVTATRINENGTFSSFKNVSITSESHPKSSFKVAAPPSGGGSLYLRLGPDAESLAQSGIKASKSKAKEADAPRKKLF